MTPGGAEALKAAIRRSLPLIVGLMVFGIIAVNLFEHLQGNKFQANANVDISATTAAATLTGASSPLIDPTEVEATAQTLAGAPQVYLRAASATRYRYGRASDLQDATSVSQVGTTELLGFTSTASTAADAIAITNAVARAYTTFRAQLIGSQVQQQISELQSSVASQPSPGQQSQIQAQIDKLELLKSSSAAGAVLVQPAITADKTSPKTTKDSVIGLTIGLVIALLLVALREAIDTTVRSESDVEELLSAPVLGSVRSLPRRAQIVTIGRYEPMFGDTYALLAAQLAPDKRDAERSVMAITSATAGEGKTTTAANLAVSLAKRGHQVLLADFDFHRPTLGNLFEIPHGVAGALTVLDGGELIENALWEIALDGPRPVAKRKVDAGRGLPRPPAGRRPPLTAGRPDPSRNGQSAPTGTLIVMPSGQTTVDDARKRTGRLGSLLRELSSYADIVILDTPPALLTVEMTELAQLVDMVVVVVRQGRVSQRTLRALGRSARTWPAELTGAVLTNVPATSSYGTYYGGK